MRKKWMIGALTIAVITGSVIGANTMGVGLAKDKEETPAITAQQSTKSANVSTASAEAYKQELLTIDEVVAIALKHVDGRVDSVELERDRGERYYEIEIENSTMEYEIEIDAYTGEVLEIEEERRDRDDRTSKQNKHKHEQQTEATHETKSESKPVSKPATTQKTPVNSNDKSSRDNKTMLTISEAIAIATAKAPGKVDEAELEKDDGQVYYEIEIDTARGEVEIEVDAYTGQILSVEYDD